MRRSPLLAVFCFRSIRVPFHIEIAVIAIQSNAKLVRRTTLTIFLGQCPSLGKQTPEFHDTQCHSFVKLCIKTLFTCVTYVLIKYIYILVVVYLSPYFTFSDFSKSYFTFSVLWKIICWSHVLAPPPPPLPPPPPTMHSSGRSMVTTPGKTGCWSGTSGWRASTLLLTYLTTWTDSPKDMYPEALLFVAYVQPVSTEEWGGEKHWSGGKQDYPDQMDHQNHKLDSG